MSTPHPTLALPDGTSAHQRLTFHTQRLEHANPDPLWQAALALHILGTDLSPMEALALTNTALRHTTAGRLRATFPQTVFALSPFEPMAYYHTITWQDGPSCAQITSCLFPLMEAWDRKVYVDPQGDIHARQARRRFPLTLSHRIQIDRRYSPGAMDAGQRQWSSIRQVSSSFSSPVMDVLATLSFDPDHNTDKEAHT